MRRPPSDAGVTRGIAARQLSVTPHTVSMWIQRGWYDPDGVHHNATVVGTYRGARLYRFGDLEHAEKCTRNSLNSARNWRRGLPSAVVARLSVA